jgi:hypothetical protein
MLTAEKCWAIAQAKLEEAKRDKRHARKLTACRSLASRWRLVWRIGEMPSLEGLQGGGFRR